MKAKTNEVSNLIRKLADDKYELYKDTNKELPQGGIMMLGDSLVQNFPNTEMYQGGKQLLNRGIYGATTYDVMERLEETVTVLAPEKVIIWIGTNDFMPFVKDHTETGIANRIAAIGKIIQEKVNDAQIIILSLLPINNSSHPKIYHDWLIGKNNKMLQQTNVILNELCRQNHFTYVDVFSLFLDTSGMLCLDYTLDGIHLNYEGYKIVYMALKKYLL